MTSNAPEKGSSRKLPRAIGGLLVSVALAVVFISDPPLWWHRAHLLWNAVVPHASADPSSAPIPSSDLVLAIGSPKREDLVVVNAKTGVVDRRLTTDGSGAGAPALSPDRRTVYYSDRSGYVHAVSSDGSTDRIVISHQDGCPFIRHVSMTKSDPDHLLVQCRNRLASGATDYDDVFKLMDLTGLTVKTFNTSSTKMDDPTLSPDGTLLAYWGSSDTDVEGYPGGSIYLLRTDGSSQAERLTRPADALDADPSWAPDSSALAFRRRSKGTDRILSIDVDGTHEKVVASRAEKPSWSPDGRQIAAVRRNGSANYTLVRFPRGGGDVRKVLGQVESMFAPVWTAR